MRTRLFLSLFHLTERTFELLLFAYFSISAAAGEERTTEVVTQIPFIAEIYGFLFLSDVSGNFCAALDPRDRIPYKQNSICTCVLPSTTTTNSVLAAL